MAADEAPTDAGARALARGRVGASGRGGTLAGGSPAGDAALALVRHTQLVSAGALETYVGCPFKWLVESELQPSELEPEPDPLARGSYIHDGARAVCSRGSAAAVTPESLPGRSRFSGS